MAGLLSMIERIYESCPIFLQNAFVSLYGFYIDMVRYGGDFQKFSNEVEEQLQFTKNELIEFQNKLFLQNIKNCSHNVPHYINLFKNNKFLLNEIKSIEDISKLPLLKKNDIKNDPSSFISNKYSKRSLIKLGTTGTTGTPLDIYCTASVRQKNYAYYDRFLRLSGISQRKKKATFGGKIIVPQNQTSPPYWRYSSFQNNLFFSSYHLRQENYSAYLKKLTTYKPHYIDTYPSSIYVLSKYALDNKIDLQGVTSGITTSAETLFDEQREVIEKVFGVPILDQYGSAEMCVFIGQCAFGNYHVHSDYSVVELLREDGSIASSGELADVVCTSLINPVMPLLRYRIGDKVIVGGKKCQCGCIFPLVEKIMGRSDDFIVTPEGNKVGRIGSVLKGLPVQEAQYIQQTVNAVTLLVVPCPEYNDDTTKVVINELRNRLGQSIKIYVELVEKINRGPGGKRKTVVSTISKI